MIYLQQAGALRVPHDVTIRGAGEGKTVLMWQYQVRLQAVLG